MNLPGKYNEVTTELIENNNEKELLIQSLKYLPKIFQDKDLFKDASKLLDACLSEEEDVLAQIHQAYCDTLYKYSAYEKLSYGAKITLLKELGFVILFFQIPILLVLCFFYFIIFFAIYKFY